MSRKGIKNFKQLGIRDAFPYIGDVKATICCSVSNQSLLRSTALISKTFPDNRRQSLGHLSKRIFPSRGPH